MFLLAGAGKSNGKCQQPYEPSREPHGFWDDHQQPRNQFPSVCGAAAAVLGQGRLHSALHTAGHVRAAQLPRERRLRRQVRLTCVRSKMDVNSQWSLFEWPGRSVVGLFWLHKVSVAILRWLTEAHAAFTALVISYPNYNEIHHGKWKWLRSIN